MVISQLLKSLVPDEQLTLTPEGAMKEIEGFSFQGPGWYITELGSMLVVATDVINTYIFSIFYGRDPRLAYQAIAMARVNSISEVKAIASAPVKGPAIRVRLIYWVGVGILWGLGLVAQHKWGFAALVPFLGLMLLWPYAIRKFANWSKEPKHDV